MPDLGVPLLGEDNVLEAVARAQSGRARALVLSGNAHFFNLCRKHEWLRTMVRERASGIRVDGAGVVLAERLAGAACPPRCTWADFSWTFGRFCAASGLRPFLLGGAPGVAEAASARWRERTPRLGFAGTAHGFFDKARDGRENHGVLRTIAAARPDVLIVGFGMPLQERWIDDNWNDLPVPAILTAGAAFDYISGRRRRPPAWMRRAGLEWLGRWAMEPRRLTGRYLIGVPAFLGHAVFDGLRRRRRQSRGTVRRLRPESLDGRAELLDPQDVRGGQEHGDADAGRPGHAHEPVDEGRRWKPAAQEGFGFERRGPHHD
jgi:N-acetylglucosaminyldiphosphoundecaprenol N-acetyl-beta-D-mannosaminyltransferase